MLRRCELTKNNSPKDRRLYCVVQRGLGRKPEVYKYTRYICDGVPTEHTRELKNDLHCTLCQGCACGCKGWNIRNPHTDDAQFGLEVYGQHIAIGMELMGGGSRRLPSNVKNDEMDNWIWICDGLVIVFLTEMLDGIKASLVTVRCRRRTGAEEEKRRVVASTQAEEFAIHPF